MTGYDTSATVYPTPQYGYEGEISSLLAAKGSSDSSDCVSISSSEDDASSREDNQPHKPVSDPAVVFSAKIENSEQATEILIEAEQYWHDDNSDDQEGNLNLRVRKPFTLTYQYQ